MKSGYCIKWIMYRMAIVIMVLTGSIMEGYAANHSGYQSLNGDYGKISENTGIYMLPSTYIVSTSIASFRGFVPPGTETVYLTIYDYGKNTAIARYTIPPTTTTVPAGYFNPESRTLSNLETSDQLISYSNENAIMVINQVLTPVLSMDQSGWLYIYPECNY